MAQQAGKALSVPAGVAGNLNDVLALITTDFHATLVLQVKSAAASGAIIIESTLNGTDWHPVPYQNGLTDGLVMTGIIPASGGSGVYFAKPFGSTTRLRVSTAIAGGAIDVWIGLTQGDRVDRMPAGAGAGQVQGPSADNAIGVGNSVPIGGKFYTPTTLTAGQRTELVCDNQGRLLVALAIAGGGHTLAVTQLGDPTAGVAHTGTVNKLAVVARGTVWNGASWDQILGSVAAGQVVKPFALPASDWNYAAAAAGILNTTTAVTIKAAAGAGVRNYITSIDIQSEALTNATEVAIRDGAGGTVLWRMKIGTGGLVAGRTIAFPSPLKSTANTLLEVVTLTASGAGAVYFNAQGFTAA